MVKEPYSWQRLVRFYKRNDITFACIGLIIFGHIAWWQVQQNRLFVDKKDRVRHLGPISIPYLDESEYIKSKFAKKRSINEPEK